MNRRRCNQRRCGRRVNHELGRSRRSVEALRNKSAERKPGQHHDDEERKERQASAGRRLIDRTPSATRTVVVHAFTLTPRRQAAPRAATKTAAWFASTCRLISPSCAAPHARRSRSQRRCESNRSLHSPFVKLRAQGRPSTRSSAASAPRSPDYMPGTSLSTSMAVHFAIRARS